MITRAASLYVGLGTHTFHYEYNNVEKSFQKLLGSGGKDWESLELFQIID